MTHDDMRELIDAIAAWRQRILSVVPSDLDRKLWDELYRDLVRAQYVAVVLAEKQRERR